MIGMPVLLLSALVAFAQDPAPVAAVGAVGTTSSLYQVGVADVLQVTVYGEANLSGQFPVDADGMIDFPLLGRLGVRDQTPEAIAAGLKARLQDGYIRNPNVTVSVSSYQSQPVQVLGAVGKPGLYFLRGPTTVMQLLGQAGGVGTVGVNEVRVTHAAGTDAVVLPYDELLAGHDVDVHTGDIVFVPQSVVTVSGHVSKPGDVSFREGLTVSRALAAVGGASTTANLGDVYILRGEQKIRVNLRKILKGAAEDVVLEAGDRVFVPESAF